MPAPAAAPRTALFQALAIESQASGENNDCAVKAVAVAANVPYETARAALAAEGRKPGKGTFYHQTVAALAVLGYRVKDVPLRDIQATFPAAHVRAGTGVTTHSADRFPGCALSTGVWLIRTKGHILAIRDGQNQDWTRGKARRAVFAAL